MKGLTSSTTIEAPGLQVSADQQESTQQTRAETCANVVVGGLVEIVSNAKAGFGDFARFLGRFATQYPERPNSAD